MYIYLPLISLLKKNYPEEVTKLSHITRRMPPTWSKHCIQLRVGGLDDRDSSARLCSTRGRCCIPLGDFYILQEDAET